MQTQDNANNEAVLDELRQHFTDLHERKHHHYSVIGMMNADAKQQHAHIDQELQQKTEQRNAQILEIQQHAAHTVMHRTKLAKLVDFFLHHENAIGRKTNGSIDLPDGIPGCLCYEAACEPGNPDSGAARQLQDKLKLFGFPDSAIKTKCVTEGGNKAVVGVTFLGKKVLDTVIDAMVARRMQSPKAPSPEEARAAIIAEVITDPSEKAQSGHNAPDPNRRIGPTPHTRVADIGWNIQHGA